MQSLMNVCLSLQAYTALGNGRFNAVDSLLKHTYALLRRLPSRTLLHKRVASKKSPCFQRLQSSQYLYRISLAMIKGKLRAQLARESARPEYAIQSFLDTWH
jgi:hypothetical protein